MSLLLYSAALEGRCPLAPLPRALFLAGLTRLCSCSHSQRLSKAFSARASVLRPTISPLVSRLGTSTQYNFWLPCIAWSRKGNHVHAKRPATVKMGRMRLSTAWVTPSSALPSEATAASWYHPTAPRSRHRH